jgi:hypothetical protein
LYARKADCGSQVSKVSGNRGHTLTISTRVCRGGDGGSAGHGERELVTAGVRGRAMSVARDNQGHATASRGRWEAVSGGNGGRVAKMRKSIEVASCRWSLWSGCRFRYGKILLNVADHRCTAGSDNVQMVEVHLPSAPSFAPRLVGRQSLHLSSLPLSLLSHSAAWPFLRPAVSLLARNAYCRQITSQESYPPILAQPFLQLSSTLNSSRQMLTVAVC